LPHLVEEPQRCGSSALLLYGCIIPNIPYQTSAKVI
jgi:hypothetical protein